jgi:Uma2 family endonuclease
MTEEEFVAWCDSDTWAEWVDGEVILMSPVNFEHADINGFLYTLIRTFVDEHDLGKTVTEPFQIRFARQRRRRSPDIIFVSRGRSEIIKRQHVDGAPDLIVEVVSPESQNRDRRDKFLEYQTAGVREYWIIDPVSKTVDVYTLGRGKKFQQIAGKESIPSVVLPGFAIKPEWLWRAKLPKVSACLREMKSAK